MNIRKRMGDFFALDIGTKSIRVVQLAGVSEGRWRLEHVGYASLDPKVIAGDSPEYRKKLGETIVSVVSQAGIHAKDVAVGLPAGKTFTTVIEMPLMPESELRSTLKYQVDQYMPIPVNDAKVDWVSLGVSPKDAKKQDVLLASTSQSYVTDLIEMIDSLGFNVIAAEPDPIANVRALLPSVPKGSNIVLDIGETSTDIVVALGDRPVLVRSLPTGLQSFVNAIVQNLNVKEDQAAQFILKFGLAPDRLEGQVFRALESTLDNFAAEIVKSIKFFQNNYPTESVAHIYLSGYAGVIPQLSEYIGSKANVATQVVSPWHKVEMSDVARQKIQATEFEYATAVGLAQRSGDI